MVISPKPHPASRFLRGLLCALLVVAPLQKPKAEQPDEAIRQVPAPDLSSAPPEFLRELESVQEALSSSGDQISVAGRVQDDSGTLFEPGDFTVVLKYDVERRGDALDIRQGQDTHRYRGGWFISEPTRGAYSTVFAASLDQRPVAKQLQVKPGKIVWVAVTLPKAAPEDLSILKGVVKDERGKPIGDATVTLVVRGTNGHFENPAMQEVTTDANGSYSFNQIVNLLPYSVSVYKPGYSSAYMLLYPNSELIKGARQNFTFQPGRASNPSKMSVTGYFPDTAPGETSIPYPDSLDIRLPYLRRVTIDYEFQVENRFIGNGGIKRAALEEGGNVQFEAGSFGWNFEKPADMRLWNCGGTPKHSHFYVGQFTGHYDLGEVDFESVKALDLGKLATDDTECRINHTYGLRTYDGKHVKFIVRNIEVVEPQ